MFFVRHLLNTLYVTTPQSYLHLDNENVRIDKKGERSRKVPLRVLEQIVAFGSLGCSPQLMGACVDRGILLSFLDMNGRFLAKVDGVPTGNVLLRRQQFRWAESDRRSLHVAKRCVAAKTRNQLVVLKRFSRERAERVDDSFKGAMASVEDLLCDVEAAETMDELRGIEGKCAQWYFSVFDSMVLPEVSELRFAGRSRRPPKDPVNALLSFFYTLLSRDVAAGCAAVGLDPYVGFLHADRAGRESLSLDLMEELRPYLTDRFVLSLVNRGQVGSKDFIFEVDGSVRLKDEARKRVISLWQKRKQDEVVHPFLGERMPVGLLPYVQPLLFARYVRGDLDDYPAFLWR